MTSITPYMSDARAGPQAPTAEIQPASASVARPAPSPALTGAKGTQQVTVDLPEYPAAKLHLSVDEKTGRVVGRVLDRESGDLLWQVPSQDMLRLIAATEEMLGPIYSTEA